MRRPQRPATATICQLDYVGANAHQCVWHLTQPTSDSVWNVKHSQPQLASGQPPLARLRISVGTTRRWQPAGGNEADF